MDDSGFEPERRFESDEPLDFDDFAGTRRGEFESLWCGYDLRGQDWRRSHRCPECGYIYSRDELRERG